MFSNSVLRQPGSIPNAICAPDLMELGLWGAVNQVSTDLSRWRLPEPQWLQNSKSVTHAVNPNLMTRTCCLVYTRVCTRAKNMRTGLLLFSQSV